MGLNWVPVSTSSREIGPIMWPNITSSFGYWWITGTFSKADLMLEVAGLRHVDLLKANVEALLDAI